ERTAVDGHGVAAVLAAHLDTDGPAVDRGVVDHGRVRCASRSPARHQADAPFVSTRGWRRALSRSRNARSAAAATPTWLGRWRARSLAANAVSTKDVSKSPAAKSGFWRTRSKKGRVVFTPRMRYSAIARRMRRSASRRL